MSKRYWALAVAVVALAGCAKQQAITEAERIVRASLVDPGSAQFQDVKATAGGTVCGMVNAKNRMGGYNGFKPFIVRRGLATVDVIASAAAGDNANYDAYKRCFDSTHGITPPQSAMDEATADVQASTEDLRVWTDRTEKMLGDAEKGAANRKAD